MNGNLGGLVIDLLKLGKASIFRVAILEDPAEKKYFVKTDTKRKYILAIFFSIVFSIAAGFFAEFYENHKKQRHTAAEIDR